MPCTKSPQPASLDEPSPNWKHSQKPSPPFLTTCATTLNSACFISCCTCRIRRLHQRKKFRWYATPLLRRSQMHAKDRSLYAADSSPKTHIPPEMLPA